MEGMQSGGEKEDGKTEEEVEEQMGRVCQRVEDGWRKASHLVVVMITGEWKRGGREWGGGRDSAAVMVVRDNLFAYYAPLPLPGGPVIPPVIAARTTPSLLT